MGRTETGSSIGGDAVGLAPWSMITPDPTTARFGKMLPNSP